MPAAVNGLKECTKCGETKPVSEYYKNKVFKDGLQYSCKKCALSYANARYVPRPKTPRRLTLAVDGLKECCTCRETKPVAEYHKNNSKADGLEIYCKACYKQKRALYREQNLQSQKRYRERNKAKIAEIRRKYYLKNRERLGNYSREYRKCLPTGVYEIKNKITKKSYIGQSTRYPARWLEHKSDLFRGVHGNSSLQAEHDKYGFDSFEFSVIQVYPHGTAPDILLEHEQRVVDEYISEGKEVYNINRNC